jgi:hypothetical protein
MLGIAAMAAMASLSFSQQTKSGLKLLPISQYMRNAGLLYLDDVDKMFTQAVDDHVALMRGLELQDNPGGMPDENIYGKALADLEDHMEINIASPSDKKFLKMLLLTKNLAIISFWETLRHSDPDYKDMPDNSEVSKLYPACTGQARGIIKTGFFNPGDCSDEKFTAARKIDKTKAPSTQ